MRYDHLKTFTGAQARHHQNCEGCIDYRKCSLIQDGGMLSLFENWGFARERNSWRIILGFLQYVDVVQNADYSKKLKKQEMFTYK